jgi:hypothetical protein
MLRDTGDRLVRVGQGEKIVEERAFVGRPGEMLGNQNRLKALGDRREPLQMRPVERSGRADRQANPVERQRVALANGVDAAMRRAAGAHVILRVDFEKPKLRTGVDNRLEMLGLEPDAHARRAKRP